MALLLSTPPRGSCNATDVRHSPAQKAMDTISTWGFSPSKATPPHRNRCGSLYHAEINDDWATPVKLTLQTPGVQTPVKLKTSANKRPIAEEVPVELNQQELAQLDVAVAPNKAVDDFAAPQWATFVPPSSALENKLDDIVVPPWTLVKPAGSCSAPTALSATPPSSADPLGTPMKLEPRAWNNATAPAVGLRVEAEEFVPARPESAQEVSCQAPPLPLSGGLAMPVGTVDRFMSHCELPHPISSYWEPRATMLPWGLATPPRYGGGGTLEQLRGLLDQYFEPFNLQHNRHLLNIIEQQLGPSAPPCGHWTREDVGRVLFSLEDVAKLNGRAASLLSRLPVDVAIGIDGLKYLQWCATAGAWRLNAPPEVRRFVAAPVAPLDAAPTLGRLVGALRISHAAAVSQPFGSLGILSLAVGDILKARSNFVGHRQRRLQQQLRALCVDVICLQGCGSDTMTPPGRVDLSANLEAEGYRYALSMNRREANAIFWDSARLESVGRSECAAGLAVDLRPLEDPNVIIRIACLRPVLQDCRDDALTHMLDPSSRSSSGSPNQEVHGLEKLVVCADLRGLGGAEAAALAPGLAGLRSAMAEITGDELTARRHKTAAGAGLQPLCCPGAVLFRGLAPLAGLASHTEGYLATMPQAEYDRQFPADQPPIVVAFDCGL